MRLARVHTPAGVRLALGLDGDIDGDIDGGGEMVFLDVEPDPLAFLARPDRDRLADRARATGTRQRLDEVTLAPPVATPGKVLCLALNYRAHAAEGGFVPPERPVVFLKGPNTLCGHDAEIVVPPESRRIDHEGELAVVIGRRARRLRNRIRFAPP